jgi:hypothetical protein
MIQPLRKYILLFGLTVAFSWQTASVSSSEVVVFDDVTTVQTPIRIKVLTKGKYFARGGRLVDIYLDETHLKRIMTGGDGYGYFKYTPENAGFKSIKARSNFKSASGLHLVLNEHDQAIVIDIEGAFKDAVFSEEIREDSQAAVTSLSKRYKIIYLSRYFGREISRSWLDKENFPTSVILRWQGPNIFKILAKRSVKLYAVIGSGTVISAAKKYSQKRYTFEKVKDGIMVKDWDEILNLLQPDEDRKQRTEERRQMTEDGKQRTEHR